MCLCARVCVCAHSVCVCVAKECTLIHDLLNLMELMVLLHINKPHLSQNRLHHTHKQTLALAVHFCLCLF